MVHIWESLGAAIDQYQQYPSNYKIPEPLSGDELKARDVKETLNPKLLERRAVYLAICNYEPDANQPTADDAPLGPPASYIKFVTQREQYKLEERNK